MGTSGFWIGIAAIALSVINMVIAGILLAS
jgi:hypothetical protein